MGHCVQANDKKNLNIIHLKIRLTQNVEKVQEWEYFLKAHNAQVHHNSNANGTLPGLGRDRKTLDTKAQFPPN